MSTKKAPNNSLREYWPYIAAGVFGIAVAVALAYVVLPVVTSVSSSGPVAAISSVAAVSATSSTTTTATPIAISGVTHIKTPDAVRAIYMSQCVVGTPSFRNSLVSLIDKSDLNAVVIDVRDYTGTISFPTDNPLLKDAVSTACGASDMKEFIAELHAKNIYVIGRITTFQNPYYTKMHPHEAVQSKSGGVWKDYKGLAFVDVGATPYWENVVALGEESYNMGFDELNFDYVRFPSDGPMSDAYYSWDVGKTKAQALEEFFAYLSKNLRDPANYPSTGSGQVGAPQVPALSADVFGMAASNEDDLGIGQVLERALPYFDFVDPMVYPSHYPAGFNGYKDVNAHPYDIVKFAMDRAVACTTATTTSVPAMDETPIVTISAASTAATSTSTAKATAAKASPQLYSKPAFAASKIRPWLQSFDYPVVYTPDMVAAQIKANEDAGLSSYLFWDAGNKYTALREVLGQ